jgi:membrane-anchored glycerophosphoryl diester phosphodiesterase (GDPDase)
MIIQLLLKLILSFVLGVGSMSLLFYLHLKTVGIYNIDADKVGRVYSRYIGPVLTLLIFALMLFK